MSGQRTLLEVVLPREHDVIDRFLAVAEAFPDHPAIVHRGAMTHTYRSLLDEARSFASTLSSQGIVEGDVVALELGRCPEHVVAVIACWLVDAVFLPLDPASPEPRRRDILEDARARAVVRTSPPSPLSLKGREGGEGEPGLTRSRISPPSPLSLKSRGGGEGGPGIPRSDGRNSLVFLPPLSLRERGTGGARLPSDDLPAYLIYTSGSTGAPKGVLVAHGGLARVLTAQIEAFDLGPQDKVLWVLSPAFDASISDIGTTLLSGAALYIEDDARLRSPSALHALLLEREISHVDLPPSLLPLLDPSRLPTSLRTIVIGGEPSPPALVRRWAAYVRLVNVYGPTEVTICTSLCVCDPVRWDRPLLGHPVPGVTYGILDDDLRPTPRGTPGELFIAGPNLALGYVRRDALNAEKFLVFNETRWYRTGDRVVEHEDGEIEFLGRLDRQLKLRGLRIEPGEIEASLMTHPSVVRAAVIARDIGSHLDDTSALRERALDRHLVAWVVLREHANITPEELRSHLAATLPRWMIPQRILVVRELAVTSSGKVDLIALAQRLLPARASLTSSPPCSPLEQQLVAIACEVLGTHTLNVDDNLHDLGLDSLGVLRFLARTEAHGLALFPTDLTDAEASIASISRMISLRSTTEPSDPTRQDDGWMSCDELRRRVGEPHPPNPPLPEGEMVLGGEVRVALLTGAAGFLGAHLLVELLRRTEARVVVVVRGVEGLARIERRLARHRVTLSDDDRARIRVLEADLADTRFGLDPARWTQLTDELDTIVHAAARVHLTHTCDELWRDNVEATREVLRLHLEGRKKRLIHASTLSVLLSADGSFPSVHAASSPRSSTSRRRLDESDTLTSTTRVHGGYAQTKWAAEWMLRQAAGIAGPIVHVRLGLLTGDTRTGRGADRDQLTMFLRGLRDLGAYPGSIRGDLAVDLTPVDHAAAAMIHLAIHAIPAAGDSTFHVANPIHATLREIVGVTRSQGIVLEELPHDAWLACATTLASPASAVTTAMTNAGSNDSTTPATTAVMATPSTGGAAQRTPVSTSDSTSTEAEDRATAFLSLCRALDVTDEREPVPSSSHERLRAIDLFASTDTEFVLDRTRAALAESGIACPPPAVLLPLYVASLTSSSTSPAPMPSPDASTSTSVGSSTSPVPQVDPPTSTAVVRSTPEITR